MRRRKAGRNKRKLRGSDLRKQLKRKKREREHEQRLRDAEMTSKYGEKAHNMCGRKLKYNSESEALSMALCLLHKHGAAHLRAYHCPYCHGWHLTSQQK